MHWRRELVKAKPPCRHNGRTQPPLLRRAGVPHGIILSDAVRCAEPDQLKIGVTAPMGGDIWVIFRHYGVADRASAARRWADFCRQRRWSLLISGDAKLALQLRAGLHLRESDMFAGPPLNLRLFPQVTAACHSVRALRRAADLGADLALVSPVFSTASHREAKPIGVHRLARLARVSSLPVCGLGGINQATAGKLASLRLEAIAAIDGWCED